MEKMTAGALTEQDELFACTPKTEEEIKQILARQEANMEALQKVREEISSRAYANKSEEYFTEDDIARENGCWVDEDGHWQPLPEDDWDW